MLLTSIHTFFKEYIGLLFRSEAQTQEYFLSFSSANLKDQLHYSREKGKSNLAIFTDCLDPRPLNAWSGLCRCPMDIPVTSYRATEDWISYKEVSNISSIEGHSASLVLNWS
jgi:hypothetical protein